MPTPSQPDVRELDARAVRTSVAIVSVLSSDRLDHQTPCADWSLRDLLAHMTVQHRGFAAAARGGGDDPAVWRVRPLGQDPVAGYAEAAEQVIAAFAADGALEREFSLPEISRERTFPGRLAMGFHLVDYIVHAWDAARVLGVPVEFDDQVLEAGLAVARAVPDGQARLSPTAAFRPALPVARDAPVLDRILAQLGRSPAWPH